METIKKLFNLSPSKEYKKEFDNELVEVNYVRSRNLSILLLIVFIILLFTDYLNYSQGLWDTVTGYKFLFVVHLYLVITVFLVVSSLFWGRVLFKPVTSFHKKLYICFFTYFTMVGATMVSVADQYIHGEITVFVLSTFLFAIINYQKPLFNVLLYSICCAIFLIGVTIVQQNPDIAQGHYLNGTTLLIIAVFLSRILYSTKVKEFNNLKTIEHQNQELEMANHELSAMNQELQASLMALDESQNIIFSLTLTLESKDMNTHGHSERVAEYVLAIANQLDLNDKDRTNLWRAAVLHDIGKIGIPDAILNKPSTLDQDEWQIMRSHPERGEVICSKLRFAQEILPIIRYHHERFDGKGYPEGLKGEEIPFLSRIVSVADTVDAMTSPRSYRTQPWTMEQAIEELKRCSGTQFDPILVEAFVKAYEANEIGTLGQNRKSLWN